VQRRQIDGYAHMQGLLLDKVFVERGVSGSMPLSDRPQGAALLAALKPGDVVIIAKLDRMFRSALDALDVLGRLKEGGIWAVMSPATASASWCSPSCPPSPRPSATGPANAWPR
jgi:DNA invertase Pin-like site-specific DNA recombinase